MDTEQEQWEFRYRQRMVNAVLARLKLDSTHVAACLTAAEGVAAYRRDFYEAGIYVLERSKPDYPDGATPMQQAILDWYYNDGLAHND